jgi:hypothetical protein
VALPDDWQPRAEAALADQGIPPRFDVRTIFAARNLYPVAALLCALLVLSPGALPAAGQNKAAEPLDWIAHYNQARGEAAAKRWTMAATQAGIAWVQHPGSADTSALWVRSAREAGFGGRAGGGLLLPDEPMARWSGLLPPLGWQAIGLAGMLLAAGSGGLLLARRFGHVPRRVRWPATIGGIAGLVAVGAGIAGVHGYGPAAAADAAIIWRQVPLRDLPVDTPDSEAKTLLAPGTAGHADRAFVGWTHLTLANGRAGWLRSEDVLPLWRAR